MKRVLFIEVILSRDRALKEYSIQTQSHPTSENKIVILQLPRAYCSNTLVCRHDRETTGLIPICVESISLLRQTI